MHLRLTLIWATICSISSCSRSASYRYCRSFAYCKKCCSKYRLIWNHSYQGSALCLPNVSRTISAHSDVANWEWAIACGFQIFCLTNMTKIIYGHCSYYGQMRHISLQLEMLIPKAAFTGMTKISTKWYFTHNQSDSVVWHHSTFDFYFLRGNS